jgi:outer membrane receptor protein involved in Fe transport
MGFGFHSNDARALVGNGAMGTPLTRSVGYELGARTRFFDRFDLAGALWMLDLDSEIVWVGDEGTTEALGRTRRIGLDFEARAELLKWLFADLDVTLARGRFRDLPAGENYIPLAPTFTLTGGISVQHPSGVYGRVGVRTIADRPLTEDNFLRAEGFTLFDLSVGYRQRRFEVSLVIDNLLNTEWREAQFATSSRLPSDPPTDASPPMNACPAGTRTSVDAFQNFAGCEGVHFTPGYPFYGMVNAKLFL